MNINKLENNSKLLELSNSCGLNFNNILKNPDKMIKECDKKKKQLAKNLAIVLNKLSKESEFKINDIDILYGEFKNNINNVDELTNYINKIRNKYIINIDTNNNSENYQLKEIQILPLKNNNNFSEINLDIKNIINTNTNTLEKYNIKYYNSSEEYNNKSDEYMEEYGN
jgi:hypothetical protein